MASFRWEINRAIKGPSWADPVDGGITGLYIDYIEFYKKKDKYDYQEHLYNLWEQYTEEIENSAGGL